MDDKEFEGLMGELEQYLAQDKVFIKNPIRMQEFQRAREIASELFQDSQISIEDDPLQMGALILRIDGLDITIRGKREIALFCELISNADNFEIYAVEDSVRFAILFNNVLVRMPQGK